MKWLKNSNGYALIIVLFLIVSFLGLSAAFVSAAMNNAKQEVTVDVKNQAVVAAEMGIKYNMQHLSNQIVILNIDYKNRIRTKMETLVTNAIKVTTNINSSLPLTTNLSTNLPTSGCVSKFTIPKFGEWIDCEIMKIETDELNTYITSLNNTYHNLSTQIKMIDAKTKYQLVEPITHVSPGQKYNNSFTLNVNPINRSIIIPLAVKGLQNTSEKILTANLIVTIPDHTSETNELTLSTNLNENAITGHVFIPPGNNSSICPTDPKDKLTGVCKYSDTLDGGLDSYIKNLPDKSQVKIKVTDFCKAFKKQQNGCNLNGLNGSLGTIYDNPLTKITSVENMNGLSNITMYIDGLLEVNNSNSASKVNLITRSLTLHNSLNLKESSIVVLGNSTKSGYIQWNANGLLISEDSKLCVNLNGVNLLNSSTLGTGIIKSDTNGKIIIYRNNSLIMSPAELAKLPAPVSGKIIYMNSFVDFLSTCGVNTGSIPDSSYSMKRFIEDTTKLEEVVSY